mmetsp:Transcript_6290/g.13645  ORF Transcript_6290/g.13645 Transcript_6290/m.13645 type:complete len:198 (-) Transcript_6290:55-648(-)
MNSAVNQINDDPQSIPPPSTGVRNDGLRSLKVIVIGDGFVGKTSFIRRMRNMDIDDDHDPTDDVEMHQVTLRTDEFVQDFTLIDVNGQFTNFTKEELGDIGHVDGAILFYALDDFTSFDNLDFWRENNPTLCPDDRFVVVGNKCDIDEIYWEVDDNDVTVYARGDSFPHCVISCCNNDNINAPLTILRELILRNDNV